MIRKYYFPSMVQAITVLTVLKMLTNAQTTCNHGIGRLVYERLPDYQLQIQRFNTEDMVRDTSPPFQVLEKCQDLCHRDRIPTNNLVRTCTAFDFQPGNRIPPQYGGAAEYEESTCYLTQEESQLDGISNLFFVPNSVHFIEVCLSSSRIETECPNRRYVFERYPRKKLSFDKVDYKATDLKEVSASNRTDCEDRSGSTANGHIGDVTILMGKGCWEGIVCLNEFAFVCRSATYNAATHSCLLTRFTRRSHPESFKDDPSTDYLENTCLNAERRCDGLAVFIKEESKRLGGPFEVAVFNNVTLEECQIQCLRAEKFFCRAIEYDMHNFQCTLMEEDSVSQKDDLRTSSSPNHHIFELVCLDDRTGGTDDSNTLHLFSVGRGPDTAFQRYRNNRLGGDYHTEITGRTLNECLDECLNQRSFICRSVDYSERFRICRLRRFNQRDGFRILYDADYDYYENLMTHIDGEGPAFRPDPLGQDTSYHGHGRPPYSGGGSYGGYSGYSGSGSYGGGSYGGGGAYNGPPGGYGGYGGGGGGGGGSGGYGSYGGSSGYPGGGSYHGGGGGGGYTGGAGGGGYYGGSGGSGYGGGSYGGGSGGYPGGPGYGGGSGYGGNYIDGPFAGSPNRPINPLCDDGGSFRQVGVRMRMRRQFIRRFTSVPSLPLCERECAETRDFQCRSFNYRSFSAPYGADRENCELSDRDSQNLDVNNPSYFDTTGEYDFYERSGGRAGGECLDVSQTCSEDGMEFSLRTPDGFIGRIYTYGFYDRCFFRGNGGTLNVLRISGAQGYPECGTQRYGDTMTNIVVVQFSDFVQTGRDKRYNLTCLFRGPGEAVVTSGYIGAGSGSPIPIEYLPAENSLSSRVRLLILYQGRPTTTIAVGDPLTFRLEAQDGYNYVTDIFATNVIARDPYSGRSVQLIDRYGCPVDNYVFPGLDRSRSGDGLEARFNAFKIPESNFLVFEATVRTCRDGCQPAYCTGHAGRNEPSFGRRRREVIEEDDSMEYAELNDTRSADNETVEEEQVREMIQVYESRFELQEDGAEALSETQTVCVTVGEYHGLVAAIIIILICLLTVSTVAGICYKRYWSVMMKNISANNTAPSSAPPYTPYRSNFSFIMPSSQKSLEARRNVAEAMETADCNLQVTTPCPSYSRVFDDPSEPIYTDPSLFERSRSLRSIAISQAEQLQKQQKSYI